MDQVRCVNESSFARSALLLAFLLSEPDKSCFVVGKCTSFYSKTDMQTEKLRHQI